MKLAGPPAMMEVLLLTNRPAPMIPPMDIIVKWRPFSERLSSYLGLDCADIFGWVIGYPFVNPALSFLPCFDVDADRRVWVPWCHSRPSAGKSALRHSPVPSAPCVYRPEYSPARGRSCTPFRGTIDGASLSSF